MPVIRAFATWLRSCGFNHHSLPFLGYCNPFKFIFNLISKQFRNVSISPVITDDDDDDNDDNDNDDTDDNKDDDDD